METPKTRVCCQCKTEKDIKEFTKDKSEPSGYAHSCKLCRRERSQKWRKNNPEKIRKANLDNTKKRKDFYSSERGVESSRRAHLKRMFGITLEEYETKLAEQNGVCYICFSEETTPGKKFLAVDHCHESNSIRGLLCNRCNRALGLLKDDISILENAIKYLKKYKNYV